MHNIHQHLLEQPGLTKAIRMETAMRFVRWSYEAKSHSAMADSLLFYKYGKEHHLGMCVQI